LLLALDQLGICASTGSACTSGSLEASHVLKAMGLPLALAQGSLRLSLGKDNHEDQIARTIEALPAGVERVRSVLPVR
jgi:cysteine desulfurase